MDGAEVTYQSRRSRALQLLPPIVIRRRLGVPGRRVRSKRWNWLAPACPDDGPEPLPVLGPLPLADPLPLEYPFWCLRTGAPPELLPEPLLLHELFPESEPLPEPLPLP